MHGSGHAGENGRVLGRLRYTVAGNDSGEEKENDQLSEKYFNASTAEFYAAPAGIWNHWHDFYETSMPVEIPDGRLLDAARAGITLSRVSYTGLQPMNQIGEGVYTGAPAVDHPEFPVASYEFVWAQQMWNLIPQVAAIPTQPVCPDLLCGGFG